MNGCVVHRWFFDWQHAVCDCGYQGRRRRLLFLARWDAYKHCSKNDCFLKYPVVRSVG